MKNIYEYLKPILCIILLFSILSYCNKPKQKEIWYCPMHTTYTSDRPGQCPICNMTLKKREPLKSGEVKDKEKEQAEIDHSKHKNESTGTNSSNPGIKEQNEGVFIAEEKQISIGIKTFKVQKKEIKKRIISSGRVAYDPELYNAIIEFREAIKTQKTLETNSDDSVKEKNDSISRSSKSRLKQLGLSEEQIREWGYSNKDASVFITGATSGVSYIYSQIYETDIGQIKTGLPIEVKVNSYPDLMFYGRIKGIDTILDNKNRTLKVRSEVADGKNLLKPQMFVEVNIYIVLGNITVIPKESVMDTGLHKMVYVKLPGSIFVSRSVKLGNSNDEYYEVKEGLSEGDEVVIGANFLLDSESKMKLGN